MGRLMRLLNGDRRDPRAALAEIEWPGGDALAWGRSVLGGQRVDARDQPVDAIRVLRRAEPRLELRPATYLARQLALTARP